MHEIDGDFFGKLAGAFGAAAAALYGAIRMFKKDRREDAHATMTDLAVQQVIQTLREEVARLSERLEACEAENRKCEARNAELQAQIIELRKQLCV